MGQICSSDETGADTRISKILEKEHRRDPQKLLLLGTAMAGKSTIFKQVNMIYSAGFSQKQKEGYKPAIFANCTEGMQILIEEASKISQFSPEGTEYSQEILKLKPHDALNKKLGQMMSYLWTKEPSIKSAFENRSSLNLSDCVEYMLDNIDRICSPNYCPTDDDVLRVRIRTSSIVEMHFKINGVDFLIVDVGGQQGERRKWIHCFDNVQAVLFVVAISEYNQVVSEDSEKKNSLLEAIELFAKICNLATFKKTAMILFLNKSDIFRSKLKAKIGNLQDIFPEYEGGYSSKQATEYITQKFREVREDQKKEVYIHVTCATDKQNIRFVFVAVKDIVLKQNLMNCELL